MPISPDQLPDIWDRYRHNFMRDLSAIARYTEREAMTRLTRRGYPKLAMNFSPPLALLAGRSLRLTDIAETLGVSKQLCLQSLKPLEQAGYIERSEDAQDKRAKRVSLSRQGNKLVEDALEEMRNIHQHFSALIGEENLSALGDALKAISKQHRLPGRGNPDDIPVSALLPPVARRLQENLMQMTEQQGYKLQMSFGQVLSAIDLSGTPVSLLAQQNGVTTQAISRIAGELEQLGYIQRIISSSDRRARMLEFTPLGLQLIADSVNNTATLARQLDRDIGPAHLSALMDNSHRLYQALNPEGSLLQDYRPEQARRLLSGAAAEPAQQLSREEVFLAMAYSLNPHWLTGAPAGSQLSPPAQVFSSPRSPRELHERLQAEHPDLAALLKSC